MTGRKRSHSYSIQLTAKWGAGGDNVVATQHYYYCVMRGSCVGMDYNYIIDVTADSKAYIAGYSTVQAYITAIWAYYRHKVSVRNTR